MRGPAASKPYLADPNYFRLGYQLAAQLLNQQLASVHDTSPGDDVPRAAQPESYDPEAVAMTVLADANEMIAWYRGRADPSWWKIWPRIRAEDKRTKPHEKRMRDFLQQTVKPCTQLVLAASLRENGKGSGAEVPEIVEEVEAAATENRVSYRTRYALACWYARVDAKAHQQALDDQALEHLVSALRDAPHARDHDLAEWSLRDPALEGVRERLGSRFTEAIEPYRRPKIVASRAGPPLPQSTRDQLRAGRSLTFDVVDCAFDLPSSTNGQPAPIEAVLTTIVAFLNTMGGQLLIGAVEHDDMGRWAEVELGDADAEGKWVFVGIDHEMDASGWEAYRQRLEALFERRIAPQLRGGVSLTRYAASSRTLALVTVTPDASEPHFLTPESGDGDGTFWGRVDSENRLFKASQVHAFRAGLPTSADPEPGGGS